MLRTLQLSSYGRKASQSRLIRRRRYNSNETELFNLIRQCRGCRGSDLKKIIKKIEESIGNRDFNINYQDGDGDTFLHAAIVENIPDVANLLLEKEIDFNISNKKGEASYQLATKMYSSDHEWGAFILKLNTARGGDGRSVGSVAKRLEQLRLYDALKEVKFNNDDSGISDEWAGIEQINSYVNQAIGEDDLAYYIGPNNFGFDSEESIKDIAKHICRKADGSPNHFYRLEESLDKPFIVISNTDTVLGQHSTDVNRQGGSHWISWVLLPKKYKSLSGKEVNNSKYQVLFFDSLGQKFFPEQLKTFLVEGGEVTETTDTGEKKMKLLPFCMKEEIDFKDNKDLTGQQKNGNDCGWWGVYYALMTVYTGEVGFLGQLKGRKLSAKPLRSMMNLQESYQIPEQKKAKIGSELEDSIGQQASAKQLSFISIPESNENAQSQPTPTATNRVVKWSGWYTEEQVKTNSKLLFLFGDNNQAKYRTDHSNPGGGGQASVIRPTGKGKLPYDRIPEHGGLNGNGIRITTVFRGGYTPNLNEFKVLMDKEFEPIETWVKEGGHVVVPYNSESKHNLGTGIADLKDKIPGAIEYIQSKVDELVRLGQQPIQDPQSKNLDTLKQELHKTLLAERGSYQSKRGLEDYLSTGQPSQPQQKRTGGESEQPGPKKQKTDDQPLVQQQLQQKRTGSESEQSGPKKQKTEVQKEMSSGEYAASGLKLSLHGTAYQLKQLMLSMKRGIDNGYNFRLATEMDTAGKFDDVVFEHKEDNGKVVYFFLQVKHRLDESNKISINDLLTEKDGDFGLQKYFIPSRQVMQNPEFVGQGKEVKGFAILANIDVDSDLRNSLEEVRDKDDILGVEGRRLKLNINKFPKKEELIKVLEGASDFNRLAKILARYTMNDESLEPV